MHLVRLTSKGQVTIPVEIRRALDLEAGDALLFEPLQKDSARFRVVRQRNLRDLAGSLPTKKPYPGKAIVRDEVGHTLGQELARGVDPKS